MAMKNSIKIILLAAAITFSTGLFSQPPPPNDGNDAGGGNTPLGGGAPIAGGISILVALGAAYGFKKAYQFNKNENE